MEKHIDHLTAVFPAQAGVIPDGAVEALKALCIPRASGGDPCQ